MAFRSGSSISASPIAPGDVTTMPISQPSEAVDPDQEKKKKDDSVIPRYDRPYIPDPEITTTGAAGPVAPGPEDEVKIETGFWETITIAAFLIAAGFLFLRT